jgi:hypothetical protein
MTDNYAHREKIGRYLIQIDYDDDPQDPREWDNLGTMACWHRKYNLGDEQPKEDVDVFVTQLVGEFWKDIDLNNSEYQKWAEEQEEDGSIETWLDEMDMDETWKLFSKYYIWLPLYLYDHGGITMNVGGFSCPWDSGQVGIIYVSKADARKEYGDEYDEDKINHYLGNEVEEYDAYLRQEAYGYNVYHIPVELIDEDEDELDICDLEFLDSCWGFTPVTGIRLRGTPAYKYALEEAKGIVEYYQKKDGEPDWQKITTTGLEE